MLENILVKTKEVWPKVCNFVECTCIDFKNVWSEYPNVLIWCSLAILLAFIY